MTDAPDDVTVAIEFGKERRANGWFVLERTVGSTIIFEYGPMAEEEIPAFIENLKAAIKANFQQESDRQRERLSTLTSPGGLETQAKKDELSWPLKRKPHPQSEN